MAGPLLHLHLVNRLMIPRLLFGRRGQLRSAAKTFNDVRERLELAEQPVAHAKAQDIGDFGLTFRAGGFGGNANFVVDKVETAEHILQLSSQLGETLFVFRDEGMGGMKVGFTGDLPRGRRPR